MVVVVNRNQNVFRTQITVPGAAGAGGQTLRLDMSLQRHAYRNLDQADAKPMNSVLENGVSDLNIEGDLQDLGRQVELKMRRQGQPAKPLEASIGQQFIGVRQGIDASQAAGGPVGVRAAVAAMEAKLDASVFGDYRVASGRTYRVDNTAINFMADGNHCYPIAGPGLWAGINQTTFAGIVAFRRLEKSLEGGRKSIGETWEKLSRDPGGKANQVYRNFTGAATHYVSLNDEIKQKILKTAGNTEFQQRIAKQLERIKAPAK